MNNISYFNLDKFKLFEILKEKGIYHLHHANTVSTSIAFIKENSLLSRKYVEDNSLYQTPQYSDSKDKQFGIWDGIFLDFIDIHQEWKRYNNYGPFLFSFSLDILKSDLVNTIRITKKNPVNWTSSESEDDWYYSDLNDFNSKYKKGDKLKDIGSMLILSDIKGRFPLCPYLIKMTLDNPNLLVNYKNQNKNLANLTGSELRQIVDNNNLSDIKREFRHESKNGRCRCWFQYNWMSIYDFDKLKRFFHTKYKS